MLWSLLFSVAFGADPVPVWPRQFYFAFNETYLPTYSTAVIPGFMAIDLDYQGGSESFYRSDGYYNGMCSGVQPNYHGPCQQVATGGWRYIIHPELNSCCRCCSDASGCGALIQAWVNNAVYLGTETVNGVLCDSWSIAGNQENLLKESADSTQSICYLDNGGSDLFTTIPGSYKVGTPDPSVFAVPSDCTKPCPAVGPCTGTLEFDEPTESDLSRAENWIPRQEYKGHDLTHASRVLNAHLKRNSGLKTQPCSAFNLTQLDEIQRMINMKRAGTLNEIYDSASDPRRIRTKLDVDRERLWEEMRQVAATNPDTFALLRDGRCRETVMWYVHHLTETAKAEFKQRDITVPLLPEQEYYPIAEKMREDSYQWAFSKYQSMATCQQCHL